MRFKNHQTGRCCTGVVEEQTVEVREKPRLLRRLAWHRRRAESLEQRTGVDDLTGLRNQRALWTELERRARASSPSHPLAVVMVDFDRFEEVNDEFGRDVGDGVLRRGASILRTAAPSPRLAFRYGGKGFVVLAEAREEEAKELAERIRAEAAAQNGSLPTVTVSCGVAQLDGPVEPWVALDRADAALRAAKRSGQNRVAVAGHTSPGERVLLVEEFEHETARRAAMALAVATLQVRDSDTADHSEDVLTLCEAVGRRLDFEGRSLEHLMAGAQLHDVGKVAIPSTILNKAGPLTRDEWDVVREHTIIGERILRSVPEMAEVATVVRHSHEHWDGSGYPDGLRGEQIPLASRVILCADAFHAMRSDRPYRRGRSARDAIAELRACAGTQLDPGVVDAFVSVAGDARRKKAGVATGRNKRLIVLLSTLIVGGGSAVAGIPEVRDALRSVFGAGTAPSVADAVASAPQEFGFGPLGDLLELKPVKDADGDKQRVIGARADRGERREPGRGGPQGSFTAPDTGPESGAGGGLQGGPVPTSPSKPPRESGPAPIETVRGNGNGRALGRSVPAPRQPAQPPRLTKGRTDPPALGLWAGSNGKAKSHSK